MSSLSNMTVEQMIRFLKSASEEQIRIAIDGCTDCIRKPFAIGFFVARFDKKPFPYQLSLF